MHIVLNRRQLLAAVTSFATTAVFGKSWENKEAYQYILASVVGSTSILPSNKYIPFDWAVSEILTGKEGINLYWKKADIQKKLHYRLRITSATDVREVCILELKTAITNKKIGELDIRFAHYMQPFEIDISPEDVKAVVAEGILLTMKKGTKPFWFFKPDNLSKTAPKAYLPHLLANDVNTKKDAWKDRLQSFESVQTFGWMQGVVWDGLHELTKHSVKAKYILAQQLDLYFAQNSLVYANLNNVKTIGEISTVESILPFAILAQTHPSHPLLKTAVSFCESHANANGVIADGTGDNRMIKTEECYTVSYPLAVLAKMLHRPDLAKLAIQTLQARIELLDKDSYIFQRSSEKGASYFGNWGRGVVWYLLGMAKTLVHLPDSDSKESIKLSFQKAVEKVLSYQQPNGLWFNFFHQSETGVETSGTAGIAAALTYGYQHGLLMENAKTAAIKAQIGLLPFISPDGYLTGTAQVNKGGDALQQNGFRVISPYTLGFFAHLIIK